MPKYRDPSLPAPFLKRVWLERERMPEERDDPFSLSDLHQDFEICFTTPVTMIVGENGTGKSTHLEAIAALTGYDDAGGGKG